MCANIKQKFKRAYQAARTSKAAIHNTTLSAKWNVHICMINIALASYVSREQNKEKSHNKLEQYKALRSIGCTHKESLGWL